jgi:hypothetical protein
MSGLDVLGALGLACNIMQIISFAHETVAFCTEVYEGRSPDAQLEENAASLIKLSADVESHYQARKSPYTASDRTLAEIAKKCATAARALEEEVRFLKGEKAKGKLAATLKVAVKTNWRKARLERLQKSLETCQHTMESHLLARVW